MIYPIKASKLNVTSKFGYREFKYNGSLIKGNHYGIDLNSSPFNINAEIVAVEDGTCTEVQKVGQQHGTMCLVVIKHKNGLYTKYYHLKSGSIIVNKGDKIKRGQVLGIIGKTGMATGTHLHFQIDKGSNGSAIDPWDYLFNGKELISENEQPKETKIYEVKKGDTLSSIARKYNTTWKKIYELNKNNIDSTAKKHGVKMNFYNYIYPGQRLNLP